MDQLKSKTEEIIPPSEEGVMRGLIQSRDWSQTAIGKRADWPVSLQVGLDLMLNSSYPMCIFWGPDLLIFHNDAYIPVLGNRYEGALGKSVSDVWKEVWPGFSELIVDVYQGKSLQAKDQQTYFDRKGFLEESYWTFSFNPIRDDAGHIGGVFGTCNEESAKIQQQRRHSCIRDLSSLSIKNKDTASLGQAAIDVLMRNRLDVMCSGIYLQHAVEDKLERLACCQAPNKDELFPVELLLSDHDDHANRLVRQARQSRAIVIAGDRKDGLRGLSSELGHPVNALAIVPLLKPGRKEVMGVLLCGLSPHLEMDDTYKSFFKLAASQISAGITDVRSIENDRRQEQQLKESEKRFRELADNVPVIIWVTDTDGKCIYTNKPWIDYSGQPNEANLGDRWVESIHPEDRDRTYRVFQNSTKEQIPFSFNYRLRDRHGKYYWHVSTGLPKFDSSGNFSGFVGIVYNIHERKLAEDQLTENEEKLRLAMEATGLGIWDFNPAEQKLYWSDTCKAIFGMPPTEEITYEKYVALVLEEDREVLQQRIQKALVEGGHYEVEYRINRKDNGQERWINATGEVYFNEKKEADRLIGTAQDITDQKLANEQKEDFLRIAGHELRTPLTSVVGYLGLLQRLTEDQEKVKPLLDKCLQSTLKMRSLIQDFLDISKVERGYLPFNMEVINFSQVVRNTIETINISGVQHPLLSHIESDIYIYGDKERLEQMILNLISNAQKYSPKDMTIEVNVSSKKEVIRIRIEDKGVGMDQKEVENIFRKFYRGSSGSRAKGMGLGLYIVKRIIDFHGGEIRVDTAPSKGSVFTVELPATQKNTV